MKIHSIQTKLEGLGYRNNVITPDPNYEFTEGEFGTLVHRKDDPELEIRISKAKIVSVSVDTVENMSESELNAFFNHLKEE